MSHDVFSCDVECGFLIAYCKGFTRECVPRVGQRGLNPTNVNGDNGIEIPEAWLPMIRKHNNRQVMGSIYPCIKDLKYTNHRC